MNKNQPNKHIEQSVKPAVWQWFFIISVAVFFTEKIITSWQEEKNLMQ
jgi:hypothetical protein